MQRVVEFTEEIDFNEIELLETVGKGAFGVVSKGKWRDKIVAVKRIESESERRAFMIERRQLSRVNHANIVKLYGACTKSPVCLVMEYAEGGSLYNVLHNAPKIKYTGGHAMSWALQCALGVQYLHNLKPKALVHRDLKPPNLLLVNRGITLKICDFGTACDLQTSMTNSKGSAAWMAPEVFEGNKYSEKCDVFSWGIIAWEVLARQKPFNNCGGSAFRIMWAVHRGTRPPLLKDCPKPIEDLITRCWAKKPETRPSMTQVVKIMTLLSKFFKGADQPVIPYYICDCMNFENDSCVCSCASSPRSSSITDLHEKSHGSSIGSNKSENYIDSKNFLKMNPNTAPASLSNSSENLNAFESSSLMRQKLKSNLQEKRRSVDLTHTFEPNPSVPTHRRSCSYGDYVTVNQSFLKPTASVETKPANASPYFDQRLHNFDSFSNNSRSPDTGRGSSINSNLSTNPSEYAYNVQSMTSDVSRQRIMPEFSNLDPQLKPLTPCSNCPESLSIYEEHQKMTEEYSCLELEMSLLNTRRQELKLELSDDRSQKLKMMKFTQDLIDLQNEKDSLTKVCEAMEQELESLKKKKNYLNIYNVDLKTTVNDEGWVVVCQ